MIESCGWLKATFSTPTRNSWKIIKGTHQEIIDDIEEYMRWGLDSSKAVKRVLPKHKHQFESLFEYKSDDEDDSNTDADSLEDKTTVTIYLRLKKLRAETSKVICIIVVNLGFKIEKTQKKTEIMSI